MEERQTETPSPPTQQPLRSPSSNSHPDNTLSPSSSSSSSSAAAVTGAPATANGNSWWDSIAKSRTSILSLSSLLPPPSAAAVSSLSNSDHPSLSLLSSAAAYAAVSLLLSSVASGYGSDPLCKWLYENLQSSDPDLPLFVLSLLPLLSSLYLSRVLSDSPLSGFEAVLLAIHGCEVKSRAGRPLLLSIPDLSHPSIYHTPTEKPTISSPSPPRPNVAVVSPPLEPQTAMKSTRRAHVVGVALEYYHKQISHIPAWSKLDFCRVAAAWAGQQCKCKDELDDEDEGLVDRIRMLGVEEEGDEDLGCQGVRIALPWEILQPCLRIISHCLLYPLNSEEVKDAARFAARVMYARASHDLVPRAILATRSLVQLDIRYREETNIKKTELVLPPK